MYRVALNTAISNIRKNKSKEKNISLDLKMEIKNDQEDDMEFEIKMLHKAIARMRKIDKAIILLYLEEKTYEEIAEIMGISNSNIGVRITRAKTKLEKIFKANLQINYRKMETDKIKTLWKKGKQINKNVNFKSKKEMETILESKTLKTNRSIKIVFYMAAVLQAIGIGIHIINLFNYKQDQSVFNLVVFSIIVLILALLSTVWIQFSFTKTIIKSQNLKEALLFRIEFYKQKYNLWLIAYAFSFIML